VHSKTIYSRIERIGWNLTEENWLFLKIAFLTNFTGQSPS